MNKWISYGFFLIGVMESMVLNNQECAIYCAITAFMFIYMYLKGVE